MVDIIQIKNEIIKFEFEVENRLFNIFYNEKLIINNATFNININGDVSFLLKDYEKYKIKDEVGSGECLKISYLLKENLIINFYVNLYKDKKFLIQKLELINNSSTKIKIKYFELLTTSYNKKNNLIFYKQGFQSISPAIPLELNKEDIKPKYSIARKILEPLEDRKPKKGNFVSDGMTIIYDKRSKDALLLGFLTFFQQLPFIEVNRINNQFYLSAKSYVYDYELQPTSGIQSETFFIEFSNNKFEVIDEYINLVSIYMKPRETSSPTGWCSWYYYYNKLKEEDVIKNVEVLKEKKNELPIEFVQIDDGYQNAIGDWLIENKKFTSLKKLSTKIKEVGFKSGIWLAPFIVKKTSRLYHHHKDWLLKDEKGKDIVCGINPLWGGPYYALDLTNNEVLDYLKEVFYKLTKEYGYNYLKLDFIFAPFILNKCKNNKTPVEIYREALRMIREVVGDDVFILVGVGPLFQSIGLVDASRVSVDVAPSWIDLLSKIVTLNERYAMGVLNCIIDSINRYFMNRFFVTDPDCVLIRDTKTKLTDDEIKTFISFVGLYSGSVFLSDNLTELNEDRLKLFKLLLPPHNINPIVYDFLDTPTPSIIILRPQKDWVIVGIFNLENKVNNVNIDLEEIGLLKQNQYYGFELWSEKVFEVKHNLKLKMEPHTSKIISIKELKNMPAIIGSNFHITCGAINVEEVKFKNNIFSFMMNIRKEDRGKIWIYLPSKFEPKKLETDASYYIRYKKDNILIIDAKINRNAKFRIEFL